MDVGCVDIYIHKFSQCDLFQLKVLAKETSILKDSVDKRDIFLTNQYPCEGRIMVIKTSILKDSVDKRDIFLTNQYPCEGRIIVIKTSILKDSDMHCL